ncbi:putative reverse transcriptase domain-containing protein, partial [Tanacetum coccineum]
VAKAIAEYERSKTDLKNAGGSGPTNAGGVNAPEALGCSYKTFLNCKPHPFNGTEGVVVLSRWFEKMESLFEISKCAEEDKVKFVACALEGCALTWWNGNIKQELWTLTLKGGDIEGYNNRFHELALMCPDLVTPERKKIERYVRGLPKRVKENVTSSKPANRHEAINMASPTKGRGYAGSSPLCNKCRLHHFGPCPPRCGKCHKIGHREKDCQARALTAGGNSQQNVTCFGCGEKGHYRNMCPKRKDLQNKNSRGREYVIRTDDLNRIRV